MPSINVDVFKNENTEDKMAVGTEQGIYLKFLKTV